MEREYFSKHSQRPTDDTSANKGKKFFKKNRQADVSTAQV